MSCCMSTAPSSRGGTRPRAGFRCHGQPRPRQTTKLGCLYTNGWRGVIYAFATGGQDGREARLVRAANALDRRGSASDRSACRPMEQPATQAQATVVRIAAMAADHGELVKLRQEDDLLRARRHAGLSCRSRASVRDASRFLADPRTEAEIHQQIVLDDGRTIDIPPPPREAFHPKQRAAPAQPTRLSGRTCRVPSGVKLTTTRAGDKGGNLNSGRVGAAAGGLALAPREFARRARRWQKLLELPPTSPSDGTPARLSTVFCSCCALFGASAAGCAILDNLGKGVGESRTQLVEVSGELLI